MGSSVWVCRGGREWGDGRFECGGVSVCSGGWWLWGVRMKFVFEFFSERWKCPLLQVFVDGAAFVVGWKVAIAEYTCDIVRFFFPLALCSMMVTGAFDTSGTAVTISFRMPITLAFAALQDSSFFPRWFEFNFGIMQGFNEVDVFVVWALFQIDKEQWKRDVSCALLNVKDVHYSVS